MGHRFFVLMGLLLLLATSVGLQYFFPAVKEVILTVLGASIALGGTWYFSQKDTEKSARYLAIRVVCVLDKFIQDCLAVVQDDGLSYGQRTPAGFLEAQVRPPDAPSYPTDVDWKSIDPDLMYKILSFPSEVEFGDKVVGYAWDNASPPDFDEGFEERAFWYTQFGLRANDLIQALCSIYNIPKRNYENFDTVGELEKKWVELQKVRQRRDEEHIQFLSRMQEANSKSTI